MNRSTLLTSTAIVLFSLLISFRSDPHRMADRKALHEAPVGTVYIIVDKSNYELQVYDDEGWYATYPVVFGNADLGDKMMEGDKKTPEGSFHIVSKRPHEKWHKMMMLDYPNQESWEKFRKRKAERLIPSYAKIGGGIAIHGTWPHDDIVVDDYTNWTNGCISLKNSDLDEIYSYIPVGTQVFIRH